MMGRLWPVETARLNLSHRRDVRFGGRRAESSATAGYGWPTGIAEDATLAVLLAVNRERAAEQA